MDALTGKARGLLLRLPHFSGPETAGRLLLDLAGAAGRTLEQAETDLYGVLRAHHVQTADNEGAGGYTAPLAERGNLDRILALYLEALGGTSQLVRVTPAFTSRSIDVRRMAELLLEEAYPLRPYLQAALPAETWDLLRRWNVRNARTGEDEVGEGLVMDLLLGRTPLAAYLAARLDAAARARLQGYAGGPVDGELRRAVARAFDARVLPDPQLYPRNAAAFDALSLAEEVVRLRGGVHGAFLRARAAAAGPDEARRAEEALEWADVVPTPPGGDLVRLNRQLLEAAAAGDPDRYPWGLRARGIPSPTAVRWALVADFNRLLEDPALAREENLAPELAERLPALRARYAGRPQWLNRALLEESFPSAVEPGHAPYRDRLLELIQVLRRGASTRRGIVDVVAANLGLVGDDPEARRARALIEVREFDPRQQTFFRGPLPFWGEVEIHNPNQFASRAEFRLVMRGAPYAQLANLRIEELGSRSAVEWPGRLRAHDQLSLGGEALRQRGETVLLNGIAPPVGLTGTVPPLPPGPSRWSFAADVVVPGATGDAEWPVGRFGIDARVDRSVLAPDEPAVELEVLSQEYHPGTFTVVIPWNIEGFTDRFDAADHPRNQIRGLVQRVRAAGVEGRVAYLERFWEDHAVDTALGIRLAGARLGEAHDDVADRLSATSRQTGSEDQDAADSLILAGVLDTTRFDSLNPFA